MMLALVQLYYILGESVDTSYALLFHLKAVSCRHCRIYLYNHALVVCCDGS